PRDQLFYFIKIGNGIINDSKGRFGASFGFVYDQNCSFECWGFLSPGTFNFSASSNAAFVSIKKQKQHWVGVM
ncbi:MAG TPA: hypothetical protein VFD35_03290, partial [Pricia sp.]|nr:hypothetical protein [Pricia sp.]